MSDLPYPKIDFVATPLDGCFEIRPTVVSDRRGFFAKVFHKPLWQKHGLCTEFQEEYLTYSVRDTLRGLHFQVPPMQHAKVVLCARGEVFDVALDLRRDSPTYGQHAVINLSGTAANAVYLPPGFAHGFCVTSDEALLYYKQSSVYSPAHDGGIRWDSAKIPWPVNDPILSERDKVFQTLSEFESPFSL
ncbi:dTDP-4-dehydrorhamnose 3,5-epimerase [Granulicella aggregans]|uniref:dTDP-4-dehydrorhamnose 3,5-epimerase n=1 Tax=Granulicella aggregans TaxID=474949 RepID=A0A7W7ZGD9_9BACT|nr:dTDP-4-dehydrorhamnose 3,5-epimerase [Granulicella aggregans]MBB5058781.1 dTDP-4-dehydrorhamnose 3,5-epimerase [Granulicella aggregans]